MWTVRKRASANTGKEVSSSFVCSPAQSHLAVRSLAKGLHPLCVPPACHQHIEQALLRRAWCGSTHRRTTRQRKDAERLQTNSHLHAHRETEGQRKQQQQQQRCMSARAGLSAALTRQDRLFNILHTQDPIGFESGLAAHAPFAEVMRLPPREPDWSRPCSCPSSQGHSRRLCMQQSTVWSGGARRGEGGESGVRRNLCARPRAAVHPLRAVCCRYLNCLFGDG